MNVKKPTNFFEFLLIMGNKIGYSLDLNLYNFEYLLQHMLKNQRFSEINDLLVQPYEFMDGKDPREFFQTLILEHVNNLINEN